MAKVKLCHCGHPIITLQGEKPKPKECFCCRNGVKFSGQAIDKQGIMECRKPKREA